MPLSSAPERWVEAHGDALYRYALARLRRSSDAEDAVQDTLLAAMAASSPFRGDSAERTWLIGILRHKLADQLRAKERAPRVEDIDDCGDMFTASGRWRDPPAALSYSESDLIENQDFWAQFRLCHEGLPPRQARIFRMHVLDECDPEDTCKQLGVSKTNLSVLLHRARLKLRACLEASWFRPERR